MATAFPPTHERRQRSEQEFVNHLVALEATRLCTVNPFARTLAHLSVSFAVSVTGAMKRAHTGASRLLPRPVNQALPEVSTVLTAQALDSAFLRALERDAKQYEAYRAGVVVKADALDPAPTGDQENLFPSLAAFRDSMGV